MTCQNSKLWHKTDSNISEIKINREIVNEGFNDWLDLARHIPHPAWGQSHSNVVAMAMWMACSCLEAHWVLRFQLTLAYYKYPLTNCVAGTLKEVEISRVSICCLIGNVIQWWSFYSWSQFEVGVPDIPAVYLPPTITGYEIPAVAGFKVFSIQFNSIQ